MTFKVGDKVIVNIKHPANTENMLIVNGLMKNVIYTILKMDTFTSNKIEYVELEEINNGYKLAERFILAKKFIHNKDFKEKFDEFLKEEKK